MNRYYSIILILLLSSCASSEHGTDEEIAQSALAIPVHQCDLLAAHPLDNNKVTAGVGWELVEARTAIAACEKAVQDHPGVDRFIFQFARALHKNGDFEKALDLYRVIAERGYNQAQLALGNMHIVGEGVTQDLFEAARWYRMAAEQGLPDAQLIIGVMYISAEGVEQDLVEAERWVRLAAEQGLAKAQHTLGRMYISGQGVRVDYTEAARWLGKAAEQGLPEAQHDLGKMYDAGLGVTQDKVRSYMWVSLAAARQHLASRQPVDILAAQMTSEQIVEAQHMAWEWEKMHPAPLGPIDYETKAKYVLIDRSESAHTVFIGITSQQALDDMQSRIKETNSEVMTWSEFLDNIQQISHSTIIKHHYMQYGVVDGIVCLVGRSPGSPWGLTWNGGIALTWNDYRHSKENYQSNAENPEKYDLEAERDPRTAPINPAGHLPFFGCM